MRWILISKKQLLDKDGKNDGIELQFKAGRNLIKYIIQNNSELYQIGSKYIANLKFKRETQNSLDDVMIPTFDEDEEMEGN